MLQLRNIAIACLLALAAMSPVFGQGRFPVQAVFESRPLAEILDEWEERFQVVFTYNPEDISKVLVSAEIHASDLREAVSQLFAACPIDGKWASEKNILLRYNPNWTRPWKLMALTGRVRDQHTGEKLSFASLFIPGSRFGTTADQDGSFFLQVPDTLSTRALMCRYLGYQAKSIPLESARSFLDIGLVQEDNSLPVIEIEDLGNNLVSSFETGKYSIHTGIGSGFSVLNSKNPLQMLQYLPGINAGSENLSELNVRGGQRDENLIMLDEIPLFHVDHYLGIFSIFNEDAISGFDFYQTDFPMEYGGRTSSILAIQGKDPNPEKRELKLGADLFSLNASLNLPIGKKAGLLISGRGSDSELGEEFARTPEEADAINKILEGNGYDSAERKIENVPLPTFRFFDLYGKFYVQTGSRSRLELTAFKSKDHLDFLGEKDKSGRPSRQFVPKKQRDSLGKREPLALDLSSHQTAWENKGISLSHIQNWSRNSYSKTYAFSSSYNRFFDFQVLEPNNPLYFSFVDSNRINYLGLGHHSQFNKGLNSLEWGFSLKEIRLDYDLKNAIANRPHQRLYSQSGTSGIFNIYGAYSLWIKERLKLRLGLRETYFQQTGEWLHSPRISASYLASEKLIFKASAGIYNQYIREVYQLSPYSTGEVFWALADEQNIPISTSTHLSLGANYTGGKLVLNLEAYVKKLDGLLNKTIISDLNENGKPISKARFFVGEGISRGVDASLQLDLGRYQGWLSYSLGEVIHRFDSLNGGDDFHPQEDQRHQFKLGNSYSFGKVDISLAYVYGSGKRYLVWSSRIAQAILENKLDEARLPWERLPDYHRVDLGATWRFHLSLAQKKRPATLGVSFYNLMDRKNVAFKQFVISPLENNDESILKNANVVGSEVPLLGFTPNLSFNVSF